MICTLTTLTGEQGLEAKVYSTTFYVQWGTGVRGESLFNNVLCTVGNRG